MQPDAPMPCTRVGCGNADAVQCEYIDRRGRRCRTAWCSQHGVRVEDHVYCRRHAGVVTSLPSADSSLVAPLPDLDNRAPSLVGWVARELDQGVWDLLLHQLDADSGAQLIADPVTLVFSGIDRRRAWERAWKLDTHTGIARRTSIQVAEYADLEVVVKVGSNVVDRLVPPWIEHRVRGETPDPETDRREREAFNQRILDAMQRGLVREQEISDYIDTGRTSDHPLHATGETGVTRP